MLMKRLVLVVTLSLLAAQGLADERLVRLFAPPALIDSGVIKHAMPRFSLKTQVRVEVVDDPAEADLVLGPEGRALFEGAGAIWHLTVQSDGDTGTEKLTGWLLSEVGMRTITSFAPDGTELFKPPSEQEVEIAAVAYDGDAVLGLDVSRTRCARCHVIDEATRKTSIGSTPSFFVLRSFGDWEERFAAFYALNPHPAFTQVDGITPPFPIDRPSPIHPIELSIEDLKAVIAYVAALPPADLGAPLGLSSDF